MLQLLNNFMLNTCQLLKEYNLLELLSVITDYT
jgi:hypothetical protein